MNPLLDLLRPYPFERLRQLIAGISPPAELAPISMSIGEPRHAAPEFLVVALRQSLHTLDRYPLALELYARKNVLTLPGSFLARDGRAGKPGHERLRISLVPGVAECTTAAERIRDFVNGR